jgi:UPF0288 family protein (methanogenesis marker protein 3)
MRVGDVVVYISERHRVRATVVGVVGSGSSGYKFLDLRVPGRPIVVNVPHANDRVEGRGYWIPEAEAV